MCSQTIWQHSSRSAQVILAQKILHPILSVCCSQSNASMHVKLRYLATFGTSYSLQMPSSWLKYGKKLRNTSPSRFVSTALHKSLLQAKIRRVLYVNFKCLFWPIKSMHSKPGFWVHFSHVFYLSKALIWHKAEEYVLKQFGSIALHKSPLETNKIVFFLLELVYT